MTSSGLGQKPIAGLATYAASKAYASSIAQALSYENEDKIDILDWVCGEVSTKMMGSHRNNPRAVAPNVAVKGLLGSIGRDKVTYGCRKHETGMWMFSSMPDSFINKFMYKAVTKSYNQELETMKKEDADLDQYYNR